MQRLRTEAQLKPCITPIYNADPINFKLCSLNCRSLHKHIDDIRNDHNYSATDISIFFETRFSPTESDSTYTINNYNLFRNDGVSNTNVRPYGGTAVYTTLDYYPGYPQIHNASDTEITITRFMILPHVTIVGIYRPPNIHGRQLCEALRQEIQLLSSQYEVF